MTVTKSPCRGRRCGALFTHPDNKGPPILDARRDLFVDDSDGKFFDDDRVFAFPEVDDLAALLAVHGVLGDQPGQPPRRPVAALGAGDRIMPAHDAKETYPAIAAPSA